MNTYQVKITEMLTKTVEVEAEDELSAEQQVGDNWKNSEYVLGADDFSEVVFEIVDDEKDTEGSGIVLKQLYDYLDNWACLIRNNNHHQQDTEHLKAEHQRVLTDACTCITQLEESRDEIAELRSKLKRISTELR
jgi:uncharacterized membrane protein YgaE (UPF0421/DUF939 family)